MVIQLKGHPTFVSDAMAKDMLAMIDLLADLDASEFPRYARGSAHICQFQGCSTGPSGVDVGQCVSPRVAVYIVTSMPMLRSCRGIIWKASNSLAQSSLRQVETFPMETFCADYVMPSFCFLLPPPLLHCVIFSV